MTDDLHSASAVIGGVTIENIVRDANGHISECSGATLPTNALLGFAGGCRFFLDLGTTFQVYVNEGDHTSCDFNLQETADNDSGVAVYNNTGGTLTPGTLVFLSGFTSTNGITMTKADADAGLVATHVVRDSISNNAAGTVYPLATVTGQNTAGRTIGDYVYLDATTAGGFTFSAPTGADQAVQIVGTVKVVDASAGSISFFPGLRFITKLPSSLMQAKSVTRSILSDAAARKAVNFTMATIATTGNTDYFFLASETGTLASVDFNGVDALAAHDTNYIQFSMVNLGQNGAGTTDMLDTGAVNSTKITGGSALAANTKRTLGIHGTPANLAVVAGDLIRFRAAANGTLANTVTIPKVVVRLTGTT